MNQRIISGLLVAAIALAAPLAGRAAEPISLKFANPSSPTGDVSTKIVEPWVAKVNKEGAGIVHVQLFNGRALAHFSNIYSRILNHVADIGFALLGPLSRQFPQTSVGSLPFFTPNSEIGTLALWHLYQRGLLNDEWKKVKPLTLMVFPNVVIHTNKPIRSLADLKGLKLSAQSRLLANTIRRLGATPITLPVTGLYQALNRGVIDGAVIGWPATRSYKLAEVTHYHLEVPLGGEVTFVMIRDQSYKELPEKGRALIKRETGARWSAAIGKILMEKDEAESHLVAHTKGQHVSHLSAAELAKWHALVEPVVKAWVKRTPNGAAVLAAYREEIAKLMKK